MSEYVDTQLLECNRLHSEEFKSGNNENPALFTNKLGSGINLDVGDVVSVHGCYVNENGAGGDTIEFKGASLGKFKEFIISNVSNTLPYEEGEVGGRLNGFKRTIIRDEKIKRELFDNKASIKIGFYLNTMGQNTLQLPRRFAGRHIGTDSTNNFTQNDEVENGLPYYPKRILVGADYKEYWKATFIFKQRIDNTRFTIFARDTTVFNKDADFTYVDPEGVENDVPNMWMIYGDQDLDPYTFGEIPRNPAFWKYKEYSQIVDLEVKQGFNSANNVAEQLTNQLKRPIKETEFKSQLYGVSPEKIETTIKTIETNCYKPFTAGSTGFMTQQASNLFYDGDKSEQIERASYDYLSCFQYVGYKRPEIQTAGRNLPTGGGAPYFGSQNYYTINKSASTTAPFVIDIEYNAINCDLFNDFFKATELYPELWDNINPRNEFSTKNYNKDKIKYETSRWLHMNIHEADKYLSNGGEIYLGGDNVKESASQVIFEAPPLFFEYKSEFKDTFFEFPNRNKLSYGCMDKDIATGYIKFYPEGAGGIPEFFFNASDTILGDKDFDTTGRGRLCGFDYSFSAWSTLAILPFAGYNLINKDGTWQVGYQDVDSSTFDILQLNGIANQVYIGSVDPKIEYDTIQNKFKISKLHSMLRQQQNSLAGSTTDLPDLGADVAGAEVYKLNPIDNYYTFTPDIIPYQDKKIHKPGTTFKFTQFNLNLEPWQIYDSYGGIFIDDFGFDSDEGLWAVLGFTQNQINAPLTSENTLARNRFDNISIQKLNKVTTNAEISSKDFSTYIQNVYGATMFTQQIVVPQAIFQNDINHKAQNYFSPVTVTQKSVSVVAENLPRRMLRPYYLLKSNLIDNNSLIGSKESGQNFNVAAIVDKQYSGGDFFFFNSNVVQFTITKPITLTSIKNSIHDPDGSFANVNEDSSVIYKIQKNRNLADLDILSQILQNRNQK